VISAPKGLKQGGDSGTIQMHNAAQLLGIQVCCFHSICIASALVYVMLLTANIRTINYSSTNSKGSNTCVQIRNIPTTRTITASTTSTTSATGILSGLFTQNDG
jgi:hypothetical protein